MSTIVARQWLVIRIGARAGASGVGDGAGDAANGVGDGAGDAAKGVEAGFTTGKGLARGTISFN